MAAWHYRHRPAVAGRLKDRQRGQHPEVIGHAWKSQHHLYTLFHRIAARRSSKIAVVATARELVGFLCVVIQEIEFQQAVAFNTAARATDARRAPRYDRRTLDFTMRYAPTRAESAPLERASSGRI
jgi:hypothetical protein